MLTPTPKDFGKQIALMRKAKCLSQIELAATSGVPVTAIQRCEQKGQIPLDRYLALTTALNATVEITQIPPPRFKTIEEVIASNTAKPAANNPSSPMPAIRKPRIGGIFLTLAPNLA
ncbi:MAG: helix-turn-helix transcriptional regulator [Verrucomicrobiae bacterium]|nr:helix-turn-helix transcriptional regulator [Verrucomicrobiae bacterium]